MTSFDPRTLAALLELLRDDSPTVVAAAREKLAASGAAGEKALRDAERGDDAALRVRARAALLDQRRRAAVKAVEEMAALPDASLDLEEGAFRLAAVEYPELDRTPYASILDSFGEQLRARVGPRHPPHAAAAELARLLAHEQRFRGNEEQFDDPDNSFVPRVLDRRKGIPISLATIYLSVARRAGLPLVGIGSPGHYLLRYGAADLDLYLDPMDGRRYAAEEAVRMLSVRGFAVTRAQLVPASVRETLLRMCANLVSSFERRSAGRTKPLPHLERWTRLREALRRGAG